MRVLANYPDSGRVDTAYMLALQECLAHLTAEELAWVTDARDGVATRTKFLPTPADIMELIRERVAQRDKFKPIPPRGPIFRADDMPDPRPDLERRKAKVMELLGYDPQKRSQPVRPPLVEPTAEEAAAVFEKLKTPVQPITPQLRDMLEAEGYFEHHNLR